jgi:hypothetical protein
MMTRVPCTFFHPLGLGFNSYVLCFQQLRHASTCVGIVWVRVSFHVCVIIGVVVCVRHHDTNERGFVYWSRGVLGCGKNEKYIAPIFVDGWRDENSDALN